MNLFKNCLYISVFLVLLSCNEKEMSPESAFLTIYDDNNYNAVYQPLGLGQSDSNIFILTERKLEVSNFSGINLLINNLDGSFIKAIIMEDKYVAPTKHLLKAGQNHYFFCMDRITLRPYLVKIASTGALTYTALNINTSYPLAANITTNNQLLLLSYNQERRQSAISLMTLDGTIENQQAYTIGAGNDVLQAITNHFTRVNSQFPFFCGQAPNNSYYFNGFYNYTLSTVFSNFEEDPIGVIQGQGTDAALKHLLPLGGDDYAFIAYQFEDHFMSGKVAFNSNEISSSINYFDRKVPEITYNTTSKIIKYEYNNDQITIIAAETEGRQVVLYFFNSNTGQLINNYLIGTLNPFTFSDLIIMENGSIGIVGTTFLADRFERIYLQKISRTQLVNLF